MLASLLDRNARHLNITKLESQDIFINKKKHDIIENPNDDFNLIELFFCPASKCHYYYVRAYHQFPVVSNVFHFMVETKHGNIPRALSVKAVGIHKTLGKPKQVLPSSAPTALHRPSEGAKTHTTLYLPAQLRGSSTFYFSLRVSLTDPEAKIRLASPRDSLASASPMQACTDAHGC